MNEGIPPLHDRDDRQNCVVRYEAMLSRNDRYFFDVEEFEMIIDHYLEHNDLRQARAVLEYAQAQHPGTVDLLFCEAHVLMAMGRLNKALDALDAIGKLEPFNEDVYLHRAGIHSQLRQHRRAIEQYTRALELAEDGLDDILLDLAFEHENTGAHDEAIACLKRALGINPENEAVLYELAYCYDLQDAHEAAATFFRGFTDDHPYSFVGWYNLGNALARLDRLEESNEALDLCMTIEEEFTSAYFSKARNLLVQGDHQGAVELYQETIAHDGPQAVTFSYIGECYEKMERFEQALIHYDQALALDPNWTDAWIGRGVVKDMQGRTAEAIKDLEVATRLAPDNSDGWHCLAQALAHAERFPEATAAYERVHRLEPQNLDAWMDHADLLAAIKGPPAGLRKMQEAEQVHTLDPRFKYRMAVHLLRSGHMQRGLLLLEEALMTDHAGHARFLDACPEATAIPQVLHLLELYRK